MNGVIREQVYAALFSFVQKALSAGSHPVVTASRVPRHFSDVDTFAEMPAVFQLQKGEQSARRRGLDARVTLMSELLVYTAASQDGVTPASTVINNILDTLDNALSPPNVPDHTQHLGLPGVVEHAWIEGKVEIYEAILKGIPASIMIIPIHILCTG